MKRRQWSAISELLLAWNWDCPFPCSDNNLLQKQAQRAAFVAVAGKGTHTDLFQQQQKSHRVSQVNWHFKRPIWMWRSSRATAIPQLFTLSQWVSPDILWRKLIFGHLCPTSLCSRYKLVITERMKMVKLSEKWHGRIAAYLLIHSPPKIQLFVRKYLL